MTNQATHNRQEEGTNHGDTDLPPESDGITPGRRTAVADPSLDIQDSELLVLVGPSAAASSRSCGCWRARRR